MNASTPLSSPGYFFSGLKMLLLPQLRWLVLLPLVINVLVFSGISYWASGQFSQWMGTLTGWLPEWLSFLEYLIWPFFFFMVMAIVFFTFTIIGNLIAAPFNALLAEKVQQLEGANLPELTLKDWLVVLPRSISRELQRMMYYLPRALFLLVLSFVPVIGAVLWFAFNGWMMAVQYCDYAADNRGIPFKQMMASLKANNPSCWFFGTTINLMMLVPLLNLLIMPAAVVGATLYWERRVEKSLTR
ncbi:sulfate transporter CysZ [Endozoicomonas sp. (ex Bugula neritina AB1)]|nr:sulfate transporter CysZ [Endozoicomonas sp. (ex Bugula neritina AB1)]